MVEKKKAKKRKEGYVPPGEDVNDPPGKEEYTLAKWMRKNVPIKKTKFMNHIVEYFTASKAIDALLESKFASGDDALFTNREEAVEYLQVMLEHKFFHRARKIPVSEAELKGKKKDKKAVADVKDEASDKKAEKKEKDKGTDAESSVVECKPDSNSEKVQRKRKIRLDMHNDQRFVDSFDAYVWIYDPIPFHYLIIGTLLVLGAIGVCLFPLWPPSVRLGVYYLSVAAAGFLVFIILLVIVRLIIFCLVWLLSAGKHHIWILPNLTEDVGFFASFWPLYKYEYKGGQGASKKKKKKDKDSDAENDDDADSKTDTETISGDHSMKLTTDGSKLEGDTTSSQMEANQLSESESESSQRSSTGKDFEIVDKDADFDEEEAES